MPLLLQLMLCLQSLNFVLIPYTVLGCAGLMDDVEIGDRVLSVILLDPCRWGVYFSHGVK